MKPVIGVVADLHAGGKHALHAVQQKYLDAVTAGAGAIALILPALIDRPGAAWTDAADLAETLDLLDGLFLTGAVSNVAPAQYGAMLADPASPADPARDHVSLALVRLAVAQGMPVLGVCRGCQEINVALGGTLHQAVHDAPGLNDHRENPSLPLDGQYAPVHEVAFTPGGMLHAFSGMDHARVNSLHGQGVETLAPPLAVEALAPDGLVEAFRLDRTDAFLLGVQWHPEWEFRDDPLSLAIFRAFGTAARAYQTNRLAPTRYSLQTA
jgi:putative glutamine amidotransferase